MFTQARMVLYLLLLNLICVSLPIAQADLFIPSGLNPGDSYHLLFVTADTRDGDSANIADYNNFVQTQASLPGAVTQGLAVNWKAIASTATVDAKQNVPLTGPVYLLDGTLIDQDGWDNGFTAGSFVNRDQFLNTLTESAFVWTGSVSSGEKNSPLYLGSTTLTNLGFLGRIVGRTGVLGAAVLNVGFDIPSHVNHMFAVSEPLTVQAVPEPSSFALLAGAGLFGAFLKRRQAF